MTKPRLIRVGHQPGPHSLWVFDVWHCRSPEVWGAGKTPREAYERWREYMERR